MPEGSRSQASELHILTDDGVELSGEQAGTGPPIVLLHGLTATRRYVVMGSRLLERSGRRVIAYDARGHGGSTPAPKSGAYGYDRLARDLQAVLDSLDIERATLAGASMGAHTIVRFALKCPERVAALGLITPAYDPDTHMMGSDDEFATWDALARGLREGGVEGFLAAYDFTPVPDAWRATVEKVVDQRLSAHDHPEAVADALGVVPRSRPFERFEELRAIDAPTVVIASRDEADPGHPLAVGERYAQTIPGASLLVEGPGHSPLAWQGGRVSRALLDLSTGA
ncbi:MAG TPA: alpha/beta hydrolase [Solirubrobacteraceae bacterium]|jgi:pimeloyl-ACP methyl ester carboxylesterase|nr:alpha/beta hydrolase [Solirubrobacteraceae bacterium]